MPFSGKLLQELRKKKGLTQKDLAEKAGIKIASLQSWEVDRRLPKLDAMLALAQALGVGLESLVGKERKKSKKGEE